MYRMLHLTPLSLLRLLLLLLPLPPAAAVFMGCNYSLFFDTPTTSLAIKKFYNNTGGAAGGWPPQFTGGWTREEPCAWEGDERRSPPPAGLRCVSGGWHAFPPNGDGGLLFLEHYSGEAAGNIPEEFKAFQMTAAIGLAFNKLTGTLWDTSYHCFLQKLDVAHNRLSGTLPSDFMIRNIHAEIINLAYNQFSGSLPRSLSGLTNLVVLLLDHNEFSGEIPDLRLLQSLHHLSLGYNKFSGRIGNWVQELHNLGWLELQSNNFIGSLPELPGNITHVDFSNNNFTGDIPESYGNLGYLRYFNCTGCKLNCPRSDLLDHLRFSSHCSSRNKNSISS